MNTIIEKKVSKTINLIKEVNSSKFEFFGNANRGNEIVTGIAEIIRNDDKFILKLRADKAYLNIAFDISNVTLKAKDKTFFLPKFSFENFSTDFNKAQNEDITVGTGHINQFSTRRADQENMSNFRRLVIPLEQRTDFTFYIKSVPFQHDFRGTSNSLVNVIIDNRHFHFYFLDIKENSYLIIDSLEQILLTDFHFSTYSIILSFGFITGNFPYGKGFYFESDSPTFTDVHEYEYRTLMDSIYSSFNLIYSNIFGYYHIMKDRNLDYYRNAMEEIDETLFSNIASSIYNDDFLMRTIAMFQLSRSYELFSSISVYSLILDRIPKMLSINYDIAEPQAQINMLESYGLILNQREKYVINILRQYLTRDDLPVKTENVFESTDGFGKSFYISLTLHGIIARFYLKYFGYIGNIINFPKLYEDITRIELTEENYIIEV